MVQPCYNQYGILLIFPRPGCRRPSLKALFGDTRCPNHHRHCPSSPVERNTSWSSSWSLLIPVDDNSSCFRIVSVVLLVSTWIVAILWAADQGFCNFSMLWSKLALPGHMSIQRLWVTEWPLFFCFECLNWRLQSIFFHYMKIIYF